MNTTRRGWLTAVSSLVALPLMPKSGTGMANATPEPGPFPRSLVDHFAQLAYADGAPATPDCDLAEWDRYPRATLNLDILPFREEHALDSIHYLRAQNAAPEWIESTERELRDIQLALRIVALLPSGRPLTFQYHGGTTPGCERTILPTHLFENMARSHTYLQGYCLNRLASRTFRLDRIENLTPLT